VSVASANAEGLDVKRDGEAVDRAQWGVPVPIDPGSHKIEAVAPGKKKFATTLLVRPSDAKAQVTVPALEAEGVVPQKEEQPGAEDKRERAAQERAGSERPGSTQRVLGMVAAGAGAVGLGIGAIFGVLAMNNNSDANSHCRTQTLCDPTGVQDGKDAHSMATVSTVGFVAGGVLLATGAVLLLTAPSSASSNAEVPPPAARVRIGLEPSWGGLSLAAQGAW
jgi:hypothetical protein